MPRTGLSVPPDAIRIEDEVWQDAFARREPGSRAARRLQALEGGLGADVPRPRAPRSVRSEPLRAPAARSARPVAASSSPQPPRRAAAPRPAVAARPAAAAGRSAVAARPAGSPPTGGGVPGRRTVTIRGRGAERNLPWPEQSRRRPPRRAYERAGFRPDRVAMWAVLLGMLLVLVALASAHG
jgi:hypothetical protein